MEPGVVDEEEEVLEDVRRLVGEVEAVQRRHDQCGPDVPRATEESEGVESQVQVPPGRPRPPTKSSDPGKRNSRMSMSHIKATRF